MTVATFLGNMIVAAEPCKNGVLVRSHVSDIDEVSVQDNTITARDRGRWDDGITIAAPAPHQIRDVSVTGNSIRRATTGITFQGSAFDRTPVCALNRVADDVNVPIAGIEVLPNASLVTGGAISRGGAGRCMAGRGDPNGRIDGRIGDIFQRLDGGPGATLYVKESDEEPDTGWSAK